MSESPRPYYSQRVGRGPLANPTIEDLARALTLTVREMMDRRYLDEWYGWECVDSGFIQGRAVMEIANHIEVETGYRNAWPLPDPVIDLEPDWPAEVYQQAEVSAQDFVFDIIEFFHRHVSAGIEETGGYHSYGECGWHFEDYDAEVAQNQFRLRINRVLNNYGSGFRLNSDGEIEHSAEDGLDGLIDAPLRTKDPDVAQRVAGAIALYRNRGRSDDDLRRAVRDLFDALEKLRPEIKSTMLRGDESDLFNIANNFSIRHLKETQKGNYDSVLWHSWMFYVNLATIHLVTRIEKRDQNAAQRIKKG